MDQLWEIALKAINKSVSTEAIHILNNYYINYGGGTLDKEEEFVHRCMTNLMKTLYSLKEVRVLCIDLNRIHFLIIILSLYTVSVLDVPSKGDLKVLSI